MPVYNIRYTKKVTTSGIGEIQQYRLSRHKTKIRAKSFADARECLRRSFKYDISNIVITEAKKPWIILAIKKLLKF